MASTPPFFTKMTPQMDRSWFITTTQKVRSSKGGRVVVSEESRSDNWEFHLSSRIVTQIHWFICISPPAALDAVNFIRDLDDIHMLYLESFMVLRSKMLKVKAVLIKSWVVPSDVSKIAKQRQGRFLIFSLRSMTWKSIGDIPKQISDNMLRRS